MNKNELVKNLKKDIQDIYTQINEFEKNDTIHLIDIDLALSKVRNLYELLSQLKAPTIYMAENQKEEILTIPKQDTTKTNLQENTTEKEVHTEVIKEDKKHEEIIENPIQETVVEEIIKEPELVIETPSKTEVIISEPSTTEPTETETTPKTETTIEENIDNEVVEERIETKQNGTPEIIADKFQSKKFVHDDIAKKSAKKDMSTKLQSKPIKDINSAIGLNDKFIFIRELFGNNKDQYHETIQILNNFDNFDNALDFLNENFNWSPDDENFERLKELVRRKYL